MSEEKTKGFSFSRKHGGYFLMKKFCITFLLSGIIILSAIGFGTGILGSGSTANTNTEYLRIHIRANSNKEADQAVKYRVRDGVVEYLTPAVAACETKEEAIAAVTARLPEVERVAERILSENGYSYGARAKVCEESFPTRVYDGATLPAGVYDALILELGSGEGDNWWCVVYPPLCFTGGNANVVYKSKIAEIIRSFFGE